MTSKFFGRMFRLFATSTAAGFVSQQANSFVNIQPTLAALPNINSEYLSEIRIPHSDLNTKNIEAMSNEQLFRVGFAKIKALVETFEDLGIPREQLPFYHSSLAFIPLGEEQQVSIFGRQSPYSHQDPKVKDQYLPTSTTIDNEANYTLFTHDDNHSHDHVEPHKFHIHTPKDEFEILISGEDIKKIIKHTRKEICERQPCTMVVSNCYSASLYMLATLHQVIREKETKNQEEEIKKIRSLQGIAGLIGKFGGDNYTIGVSTNPKVTQALMDVATAHKKLFPQTPRMSTPT